MHLITHSSCSISHWTLKMLFNLLLKFNMFHFINRLACFIRHQSYTFNIIYYWTLKYFRLVTELYSLNIIVQNLKNLKSKISYTKTTTFFPLAWDNSKNLMLLLLINIITLNWKFYCMFKICFFIFLICVYDLNQNKELIFQFYFLDVNENL